MGLFAFNFSCTHMTSQYYDTSSFSILTYNLFDQFPVEENKDFGWEGDWLLQ